MILFYQRNIVREDGSVIVQGDRISLTTRYAIGNIPYFTDETMDNAVRNNPDEFLTWNGQYPEFKYPWYQTEAQLPASGSGSALVIEGGGTNDNPVCKIMTWNGSAWVQTDTLIPYIFRGEDVFVPSFMPMRLGKPWTITGVYAFCFDNSGGGGVSPVDIQIWAGTSPSSLSQIGEFNFGANSGEYYMDENGTITINGPSIPSASLISGDYSYLEVRSTAIFGETFKDRNYVPGLFALVGAPADATNSDMEQDILGGPAWTPTDRPTWGDFFGFCHVRTESFNNTWHTTKFPQYGTARMFSLERILWTSEQHHHRKVGNNFRIDPRRRATIGQYPTTDEYFVKYLNNGEDIEDDFSRNVANGRKIVPVIFRTITLIDNDQVTYESPVNPPQYSAATTYNSGDYVCQTAQSFFSAGARCLVNSTTDYNPWPATWASATSYSAGDNVKYLGSNWKALTPVQGVPPSLGDWELYDNRWEYTDGVVYIPNHIIGQKYNKGAVVASAGGFFYESLINNNTTTPPNSNWQAWTKPTGQLFTGVDDMVIQKAEGTDGSQPSHYGWDAALAYQIAAAHGNNQSVTGTKFVDPLTNGTGTNLITAIHLGNEQDKQWRGIESHFKPIQQAAHWSAMIDGHCGTMGAGHGVWNADPDLDIWLPCFVDPRFDMFYDIAFKYFFAMREAAGAVNGATSGQYEIDPINNGNPEGTGRIWITHNAYSFKGGDQDTQLGADDIWNTTLQSHLRKFITFVKSLFPNAPVAVTETGFDKAHDHEWTIVEGWNLVEGTTSNSRIPFNDQDPSIGPVTTSQEPRYYSPYIQAKLGWRLLLDIWEAGYDLGTWFQWMDNTAIGGIGWVSTFSSSGLMQKDGDLEHGAYIIWCLGEYLINYKLLGRTVQNGLVTYSLIRNDSSGDRAYIVHLLSSDGNTDRSTVNYNIPVANINGEAEQVIPYSLTQEGYDDESVMVAGQGGSAVTKVENRYPTTTVIQQPATTAEYTGSTRPLTITSGQVNLDVYEMPLIIMNYAATSTGGNELASVTDDTSLSTFTHQVSIIDYNAGASNRLNIVSFHGIGISSLAAAKNETMATGIGTGGTVNDVLSRARTILQWCIANNYHLHVVIPYVPGISGVGAGQVVQYYNYFNTLPGTTMCTGYSYGGILTGKSLNINPGQFDKYAIVAGWLEPYSAAKNYQNCQVGWWHGLNDNDVTPDRNITYHPDWEADAGNTLEGIFKVEYTNAAHGIDGVYSLSSRFFQFLSQPASQITDYLGTYAD